MKKLGIALLLVASTALAHDKVVKRGAAISNAKPTPLADVMKTPDAYTKTPVVVEGVVEKVCKQMGCWMELTSEAGKPGIRVTFEDFVVPKDSTGYAARVEGVTVVKTLSKDEADHLEHDGAKIPRNEDGTAKEVSFAATGVELKR